MWFKMKPDERYFMWHEIFLPTIPASIISTVLFLCFAVVLEKAISAWDKRRQNKKPQ
jgi:hypothetical protein